ncbi:Na(+)-translocating NADH-quinone reductase subunit C [Cohaesibacter celericrescens]|jgi:Na+-transporting NADH:ubiquinone oxidoreductase subunit C|uniref:Na(+)-translocating NADH-quinone reductase subunit C n=1 Tax=Cohaesibacter celericrescens TaxID=2067669 RepID=A0A2N5XVB1_9HYPH|nr:Na(+)-translocating NADH-quinone reductase subunit C [Cohaesibacter celericrescens]PLW78375.1 Na(+)-translocating NADH-quinone reductase subunit C [Cohaesibacter celericrescens]
MPEAPEKTLGPWGRFLAMPADNPVKTVIVAVGLCLFCSMIVSAAAVALKPIQEQNKVLDKKRNILQVAGLFKEGIDVNKTFETVEPRLVDIETGTFTDAADAATYDQRAAAKDPAQSVSLAEDPAGIGRQAKVASVYLIRNTAGAIEKIILPVHGYGLWSTLYGFVALKADGNEVAGFQFYEHAETPGLGAEVDNPKWKALWPGKKIYGDDGDVKISIAKGAPSAEMAAYHIDSLAGATLTSRGVDNLVRFWMGEQGFKLFLENLKAGAV